MENYAFYWQLGMYFLGLKQETLNHNLISIIFHLSYSIVASILISNLKDGKEYILAYQEVFWGETRISEMYPTFKDVCSI